jgi:hypothetical protein
MLKVNYASMSKSAKNPASPIEFNVDIRFHTEDVDILFCGRDREKKGGYIPRYPIVARTLQGIYAQMLADNPFAESMLIEFEVRLDQLFGLADNRIERCEGLAARAQDQEGVTIRPFTRHFNEYGRYLLRSYGRLDLAIRWLRTVNSSALMGSKLTEQWIRELLRRQRAVNDVMVGYAKRLRPVTRQEVLENSENAQALSQALRRRVLPEVLNKQRRCRFYRVRSMAKSWDGPGQCLDDTPYPESDCDPKHRVPQRVREAETHRAYELPLPKGVVTDERCADIATARHCGRKRQE